MTDKTIPKVIHFIWLGKHTYPENTIHTWKTHNPEWTVRVWKDDDVSSLTMTNDNIYQMSKNNYQKSDILRWEILYSHGGVYCDTDVVCMKAIDDVLCKPNSLTVVQEKRGVISNSFISTPKFNQSVLDIMRSMNTSFDPSEKVWKSTGSLFLTRYLLEHSLVVPCESDKKYDYGSTQSVSILPYYYMNINRDNPRLFMELVVDETVLNQISNNKDEKYVKYNQFDDERIYASQLWGGGKQVFYNDTLPSLDMDMFYKNLYVYISHISKLNDYFRNREDRIRNNR